MTRKELEKLYYLNKEIFRERRRLEEFDSYIRKGRAAIEGLPHIGAAEDKEALKPLIEEMREMVEEKIRRSVEYYQEIMLTINGIENDWIRQIVALRCLNCLSWGRIAFCMGGKNTEDGVKRAYYRFFNGQFV